MYTHANTHVNNLLLLFLKVQQVDFGKAHFTSINRIVLFVPLHTALITCSRYTDETAKGALWLLLQCFPKVIL